MVERRLDYPYGQVQQSGYAQPPMNRKYASAPAQGYRPAPAQSSPLDQTQVLTPGGFKPLSKEEREEAAKIALEAGFSFDGYQVVRREFFSHRYDPTLTIKGNSIIFNNSCISKLEQVVYVQILVNPIAEKLVIRPCDEGARDAIRWCVMRDDKRKSRQITCGLFTAKLYDMMGWEALYRYKLQGTRINYQGEQLYVFDLTSTEAFLPQTKEVGEDGKLRRKRAAPMYPANWRDSFGLPVVDHMASTQINLLEGYEMVDDKAGLGLPGQIPMEQIDQETGEVTKV